MAGPSKKANRYRNRFEDVKQYVVPKLARYPVLGPGRRLLCGGIPMAIATSNSFRLGAPAGALPRGDCQAGKDQSRRCSSAKHLVHRGARPWPSSVRSGALAGRPSSANSGTGGEMEAADQAGSTQRQAGGAQRSFHVRGWLSRPHARFTAATHSPRKNYHEGLGPADGGLRLCSLRRSRRVAKLIDDETCAHLSSR